MDPFHEVDPSDGRPPPSPWHEANIGQVLMELRRLRLVLTRLTPYEGDLPGCDGHAANRLKLDRGLPRTNWNGA